MRLVDAARAVAGIRSGKQVYVHAGAATPSVLLDALVARAAELTDVKIVHFHTEGPGPHLRPEMAGHFHHRALFVDPNARAAVNEGRAEYIPAFLSDVPSFMRRGILPLDAVLVNLSPPDKHGYCSLGTSVIAMPAAIKAAKTVIAQLNQSVPRTLGDTLCTSTTSIWRSRWTCRRTRTRLGPQRMSSGALGSMSPTSCPTAPRCRWA